MDDDVEFTGTSLNVQKEYSSNDTSTIIYDLNFYALKHIYNQLFSSCKEFSFYFAGLYKRH